MGSSAREMSGRSASRTTSTSPMRRHGGVLVTKDPDDFDLLHQQNPNHHGIFGIFQDNDPTRDMSQADIVAAIQKIEEAVPYGYVIAGEFHNLNLWR